MNTKSFLVHLVAIFIVAMSAERASAHILASWPHPDCPDDGRVVVIQDDETKKVYWHVVGCDGSTCIWPEPFPFMDVQTPLSQPGGFWDDVDQGLTVTTPNTMLGVHYIDAASAQHHPRTCQDAQELAYYQGLWEGEQEHSSIGVSLVRRSSLVASLPSYVLTTSPNYVLAPDRSNVAEGVTPHAPPKTTEFAVRQELMNRYHASKPQITDDTPADVVRASLQDDFDVIRRINRTGSNLEIEQFPDATNGYIVVIAPIREVLGGRVVVSDESGATVWTGDVTGRTSVDLSAVPSGLYFVQGMGRAQAVPIVR